jgi:hypothetical protein
MQGTAAVVCLFGLVASNTITINSIGARGRWIVAVICNWAAIGGLIVFYHQVVK